MAENEEAAQLAWDPAEFGTPGDEYEDIIGLVQECDDEEDDYEHSGVDVFTVVDAGEFPDEEESESEV